LQDPPKFTQIDIFGLKIYHLATLVGFERIIFQKKMKDYPDKGIEEIN
jgi:hypothetical protein